MDIWCPICHSNSRYLYQWTPPYSLYYCPSCKTLFSNPIPSEDELNVFYQGFLYRKPDPSKLKKRIEKKKKEIHKLFGNAIQTGRTFLDYGGGTGITSLAAAQLGLEVTLYEIDNDALEYVKSLQKECSVQTCCDLSELEDRTFDLIFVDNVIEHAREPQVLLRFLYDRLEQQGQMMIKTPYARNTELLFHPTISVFNYLRHVYIFNGLFDAVSAAFFRPWTLDPPRHLYSFSARSLHLMAEQTGVDKAEIGTYRIPLWEYSITKRLLHVPKSLKGIMKWFVMAIFSLCEIGSKCIEWLLRTTNIISAGGLYIRIQRD